MKLTKLIRYIRHKKRLMRFVVVSDIAERERIINSYFQMAFRKYPELFNTSCDKYIRFNAGVSYYERSAKFKEFETNATALCKRLGYCLHAGWSGGTDDRCDDKKGYYFYSVHPDIEISRVKMELEHSYIYTVNSHVENYYEKLKKLQQFN